MLLFCLQNQHRLLIHWPCD